MGYYSRFKITHTPHIDEDVQISDDYEINLHDNLADWDSMKWYEYHDDMLAVSRLYPHVLFEVTRIGERAPDIEFSYYKGGAMYSILPKIERPPFDETKMPSYRIPGRMED